ncbi:nuclease PIN [Gilvibacter sp. SZ-19]|uniref:pirin family protein n=1 Tax=unclassified Gilvibacter TaxID=2625242 RepID=UPI000B3C2A12|nr:pirin family protein [Gilvibacter sp. SZ-19]ARV13033.1 nuclease PIN [Gilvibacter sp. SZ-19]
MKRASVKQLGQSPFVNMGPIELRQPIPTRSIDMVDPFVLLHHYGPYEISPESNPFDLGPHPHRGFEPITFLIQGEQLHRDSLGNESVVRSGDVQWTTAGRGIIHAEAPTKEFVQRSGTLEGIQLWLNLPAAKKMIPANYQHVRDAEFEVYKGEDGLSTVQIVAGNLADKKGKIATQTAVNAFMLKMEAGAVLELPLDKTHYSLLYLLHGAVNINGQYNLMEKADQLVTFEQDGDSVLIKANEAAQLLFLSGEPFHEEVASWGPYVMNTQTEIMEALRDYQMGKMGYLSVSAG